MKTIIDKQLKKFDKKFKGDIGVSLSGLGGSTPIDGSLEEVKDFISTAIEKAIEDVAKRVDVLMDKDRAKDLADNFELFNGERSCSVCGCDPEKQRKLILETIRR